jgi:hypothetical protein
LVVFGKKGKGGTLMEAISLTEPRTKKPEPVLYPILEKRKDLFPTAESLLRIGPYNLDYEEAFSIISGKRISNPEIPVIWQR